MTGQSASPPRFGRFEIFGWIVGFAYSLVVPKLTAPMSLSEMFDLGGSASGMLGFAGMFWFLSQRNMRAKRKLLTAAGALTAGIITGYLYRRILLAPEYVTPGTGIVILELLLYCIACFCFGVVLSYVYWYGGPYVVKIFNKNLIQGRV